MRTCPEAPIAEVITITPYGARFRVGDLELGHKRIARERFPDDQGARFNVGFQGAVRRELASATWTSLFEAQMEVGRELSDLVEEAPFRLRPEPENAPGRVRWMARLRAVERDASRLAPGPAAMALKPLDTQAEEDRALRTQDPTSEALEEVAHALESFVSATSPSRASVPLRKAAMKAAQARDTAGATVAGLGTAIPDQLAAQLECLAAATVAAEDDPRPFSRLRFGDHHAVDQAIRAASQRQRSAQRSILEGVLSVAPDTNLIEVLDSDPFPGAVDAGAWVLAAPVGQWTEAVDWLAGLPVTTRASLGCRVVAVATNFGHALPLASQMLHHGAGPALPLTPELRDPLLSAANLELLPVADEDQAAWGELLTSAVDISWRAAMKRLRPREWPAQVAPAMATEIDVLRRCASEASKHLPSGAEAELQSATTLLLTQLSDEVSNRTELSIYGEILADLRGAPSPEAITAGLTTAITTLALAPSLIEVARNDSA